jgi:UDP-glucose 4-epimerase
MMNTLVIGGAGYLGMHVVPELLSIGRSVTVLDRRLPFRQELPQGVAFVEGSFADTTLIRSLLESHQEVIQLAYATVPNTSFEDPLADLLQNLPPTVQLFSQVADAGRKLLLVSSGGTVYGEARTLPIREDHPTKPISPYGVTKLTLENYAHLFAVTRGLKFICVRPGNAFGAGQQPFAGQGFISTAMAAAMRGLPVTVYGEQGTVRDYISVCDIASGIVRALTRGELSETYNIGSGAGLSNMQVIEAVRPLLESIGCPVTVEHLPERAFDVRVNVLDSTKLHKHTGWQPRVAFHDELVRMRDWLCRIEASDHA